MQSIPIYFLTHYTTQLTRHIAAKLVAEEWTKLAPLFNGAGGVFATVTHTRFPISSDEFGSYAADYKGWSAYQKMTQDKFCLYDGPFFRAVTVLLKDMYVCDLMVSRWTMFAGKVYHVTFFAYQVNPARPFTVAEENQNFFVPAIKDVQSEMPYRLQRWFPHYKTSAPTVDEIEGFISPVSQEDLREIWAYSQCGHPGDHDGTRYIERDPLGFTEPKVDGFFTVLWRFFFKKRGE